MIDINGSGMTKDVIENIWLEPGADHRKTEKELGKRTNKHQRLPLGEKGVGRFAVHKLGRKITLETRAKDQKELTLTIDWDDMEDIRYMEDFSIEIKERDIPEVFIDGKTGTKLTLTKLYEPLTRGDIRNLHRNIESIKSPFEHKTFKLESSIPNFDVSLSVEGKPEWTQDLYDIENILEQAIFKFIFFFEGGKWFWQYEFSPNEQLKKELKISTNKIEGSDETFRFSSKGQEIQYKNDTFDDLGEIFCEVYVFDFDKEVRDFYPQTGLVKNFLQENKGIRIYRDGVRVYNYGEPSDDWLEMDQRRVNKLGSGLNRSITVGALSLNIASTPTLIEKTNREGFIENNTFRKLVDVVGSAISKFESLRDIDKKRLRIVTEKEAKHSITSIENPIEELRKIATDKNIEELIEPKLVKIEKSYNEMREIMLNAGMAGLNMTVAFHEIHRGIKDTRAAVAANIDKEKIILQFDRFELLLDTYAKMLKKEKIQDYSLKKLLQGNMDLAGVRYKMHDIVASCPLLVGEQTDVTIKLPPHLMTSVINNIIDNSIYWLDQRWGFNQKNKKFIYIGISDEFDKGPAIIIADNGTGWKGVSPSEVIKPFLTTKPGGMGIGLYYANTIMEMLGGEMVILNPGDIEHPAAADGAVIALVFKDNKNA